MASKDFQELISLFDGAVSGSENGVSVTDEGDARRNVYKAVESSVLGTGAKQAWARYLVRLIALELDILPSSIHDLYIARGRGDVRRARDPDRPEHADRGRRRFGDHSLRSKP